MTTSRLLPTLLTLGALTSSLIGTPAAAQSAPNTSAALAWVGCWEPMDAMPGSLRTCVVPTSDLKTLRLLEVEGDRATEVATVVLDGEQHPVAREGCTGWERARLAADGGRIFLDAEVACGGLPTQKRAGAFLITPRGDWLQVQGSGFDEVNHSRVRAFRESYDLVSLPLEVRQALGPVLGMAEASRAELAGRKLSAEGVLEMARLGVATPIVDVIVAAGFPKAFMLDPEGSGDVMAAPPPEVDSLKAMRLRMVPMFYGFGYPGLTLYNSAFRDCALTAWGMFDYSYCMRTSQWSRYGYAYGYANPFGYPGWYPRHGGGGGTIVVVRPSDPGPRDGGGRVVKGQGYTPGGTVGSSGGGVAQPRTRATPSQAAHAGSSAGSSGGSSSAGAASSSSGSSSSSGRTAKPRDP